jgi:hypothetical protein
MVQTPPNHQYQLIDQALSLLRNAMAETEPLLPGVEFHRAAQPKDVVPKTPVREERTASLVGHGQSLVENLAVAVPKKADTTSITQHPIAKQTSKDVLPAEPSAQQQQTDALINQTLSLIETVTEVEEPEETPCPMQQPVAKQLPSDVHLTKRDRNASLIDQALSLVKNVAVPEPKPIEVAPPSWQPPRAKQLTPKERLDMERADIQKRVATFTRRTNSVFRRNGKNITQRLWQRPGSLSHPSRESSRNRFTI